MARLTKLSLLVAALCLQLAGAGSFDTSYGAEPAAQFPYSAFVAPTEAPVRSGPGETYYPVLNLKLGDAVEVWRQDPGGWLAVRPPEGAFSWVSADFIQQTGEKTGRVVGNEVNARVGTKFSDLRDAIQVQLSAGDEVDILESRTLRTGDQETLWYKILPPAGEFRWIAARHVVLHPSQLPAAALPNLATGAGSGEIQPVSFNAPVGEARAPSSDLLADLRRLPADASVDTQLDEMELVLSRMVTTEPTAWSFDELKQRAETLVERSQTAVERSRARMYLGKLARFEDIRKRYSSIVQLREQTATVDRELTKPQPAAVAASTATPTVATTPIMPEPEAPAVVRAGVDVSRYDGVGRLMQVVNAKAGSPNYALANASGQIAAYVVAAPGMNLRQYLGLDVGVSGIRGFVTDQRIEQITAKHIDVLGNRSAEAGSRTRRK
ncbi:MAG: SH3 domain-containing protein [Planctomycetia bacterium]|nr:SH3 domain-containing protein [Planctomycetia bacterium]